MEIKADSTLAGKTATTAPTRVYEPDNVRNWLPLLLTYAYIALVVWGALEFFRRREGHIPWWTDIPVGLVAVALIGPAQHRLWLLGQEAALGLLFRNRFLNELAADWLIHFPFSTATHHVRLQYLSHLNHPNDPLRDAERVIAERTGFHPLKPGRLGRLSALIRWNSLRTGYNFEANPHQPYFDPARPPSRIALHLGTAYVLVMFAFLIYLFIEPNRNLLLYVPPAMWVAAMAVFASLPERCYHRSTLSAPYSAKVMTLMRLTFITLVNCGLGWISYTTERSAVLNYVALWMGPLFTSTSILMIVRSARQHQDGGTTPATCTRDEKAGPLARILLFPIGEAWHRRRHLRTDVPWYDLARLDESEWTRPPGRESSADSDRTTTYSTA